MKNFNFLTIVISLCLSTIIFSNCGRKGDPKPPQEYNKITEQNQSEDFCE
jgi:PBP1b-binding outer membrane lipoprotein LpoB